MTGPRESWLLDLLVALPLVPPKIAPMLNWGAGVVRKTHGFRMGICGICSDERAASVTARAASRSRLFRRMFRSCTSSTSLTWRALTLLLFLEWPWELTRQVSEEATSQRVGFCSPL